MKLGRCSLLLLGFFWMSWLVHAQTLTSQPNMSESASAAASQDYRLGAGDSIGIQVYQSPDLTLESRVSENGVVSYPLIGNVQLGGLSLVEAEKTITRPKILNAAKQIANSANVLNGFNKVLCLACVDIITHYFSNRLSKAIAAITIRNELIH